MSAASRRGWCPTLFAPMATGDGLLVRVRPPCGVLTAAAARVLAAAAVRDGNGVIELTNRASLQVRGLTEIGAARFAATMVAAGLADPDPAREARRVVMAPPLAGDDPAVGPAAELVAAIEARLADIATLPGKFAVAVDGGGVLPLAGTAADVTVTLGEADAPGRVARAAADCIAHGRTRGVAGTAALCLGWLPYPGMARGAFGIGLPFGATDAGTLAALADIADAHGDGALRLTPWRALVIGGVTRPEPLAAAVRALGLITERADPRTRLSACPGAPACASASVPARADAVRLTALGFAGTIHVSGCAKGCAHPDPADVTLVGEAGRYGLVRHGRAGDAPTRGGLSLDDAIALLAAA